MAVTYSIGTTGALASSVPQAKVEKIDDTYATVGGMQYAMMKGQSFNVQGQDGRIHVRTLDAERWRSDIPILNVAPR